VTYSRFYLSDLHVHTPADANHRYGAGLPRDPDEAFAKLLIEAHVTAGVQVIAVTDHNRVDWWPAMSAAGKPQGVTVFPGVEISVNRCHLVAIFEASDKGYKMAQQFLADRFDPGEPLFSAGHPQPVTRGAIRDAAEAVGRHAGLLFAPHSTSKGIGMFAPSVCTNSAELAQGELFAGFDVMGDKGADVLRNPKSKFGAVAPRWFLAGDTRGLDDVGRRAVYLKLGAKPTLEGLRQAFLATSTRVRFPEPLRGDWGRVKAIQFLSSPSPTWPRLTRLKIQGGFHSGLDIPLAPGLNAVIGGKGTGKSALIEALRYIVGARAPEDQTLQDNRKRNFPANADGVVEFVDVRGDAYEIRRSGGTKAPELYLDGTRSDVDVKRRVAVQIFGQRELRELLQPAAMREFLARQALQAWDALSEKERSLLRDLDRTDSELAEQERALASLEELRAERADLSDRVKRARKAGAEQALAASAALTLAEEEMERALRWPDEVAKKLAVLSATLPPPELTNVADIPKGMLEQLKQIAALVATAVNQIQRGIDGGRDKLEGIAAQWDTALLAARADVERRLAEAGVTNAEDLGKWQGRLGRLDTQLKATSERKKRLGDLETERQQQLQGLNAVRRQKSRQIEDAAQQLQEALPARVRLRVTPLADRTQFMGALEHAVLRQSVRGDQLRILADLEPTQVAGAMAAGTDALVKLGVSGTTAAKLVALSPTVRRSLELADVPDLVELDLDLSSHGAGEWRSVHEVSPGQRATALLALVLAGGNDPLIIDQPEDDLDNRYIYDEVVKTLAKVCERRQVLVATHNANIPILGDAELIVALDAGATQSRLIVCGGLEVPAVAAQARQILEGGDAAFQARRRRYLSANTEG